MYHYVEDKDFLKASRSFSSKLMCRTRDLLHEEGINSQAVLVGSGARNLITQNAGGPIDFDYNLEILDCEDFGDCKGIKTKVKKCFDKALREQRLPDSNDSTSVLTSKEIMSDKWRGMSFSIDVCITYEDRDQWYRLIHDKDRGYWGSDRWFWNEGFTKYNYTEKAKKIKKVPGAWPELRDRYLDRKNRYLQKGNTEHPSFICYVEVVNEYYDELKRKGKIKQYN